MPANIQSLLFNPAFWFALYAVTQALIIQFVPQVTLDTWKLVDALIAVIIGSLTGTKVAMQMHAKSVAAKIAKSPSSKLLILLLILIGSYILFVPQIVSADSPLPDQQPWMYAAVGYTGLGSVANVQIAFRNYQNEQAKIHQYKPFEWALNYSADVTSFLRQYGCASCWIDGIVQSPKLLIDEPIYMRDLGILFPD